MSGDKLSLLLFLVGTVVAGVMGALTTNGWRARVLSSVAVIFCLATLVAFYAQSGSLAMATFRVVWMFSPPIGVAIALLITGGRKPIERRLPLLAQPKLNPGLTARYVEDIVKAGTQLDTQRRIEAHMYERAKLVGQVRQIKNAIYPAGVRVDAALPGVARSKDLHFKTGQDDALAVIKIGDWIEFTGRIDHSPVYGWEMSQCEFIGLVQPPSQPPRARKKAAP